MPSLVKVFLSHKKEDGQLAANIAAHLTRGGLQVYLDTIDLNLDKDGPDLADYIRLKLEGCTQLLAVISERTRASWWVPWEIGVATEKERFLSSYVADQAPVPEYLEKWPYLRSRQDLDIYIKQSLAVQSGVDASVQRGFGRTAARSSGFRQFHRGLKAALRQ